MSKEIVLGNVEGTGKQQMEEDIYVLGIKHRTSKESGVNSISRRRVGAKLIKDGNELPFFLELDFVEFKKGKKGKKVEVTEYPLY